MMNIYNKRMWLKLRHNIIKIIALFLIYGSIYYSLEVLYRGYSHISMFILAGVLGVAIGLINEITPKINIWLETLIGTIIATIGEGVTGIIVNNILHLNVWDYSNLPFTFFYGQCNLIFCLIWFILTYIVIKLDDYLRSLMD